MFKHYPDFLYRCAFDAHPELTAVAAARCITSEERVGGEPYYRLNTPSAGNLHPVELYVQIRGVKGVLAGIYHVDALRRELVLLRECGPDGLEPLLGLAHRFEGVLFMLSVVPFRSEWKYGHRAWRYCYMDAGHQIGALCASMAADGREAVALHGVDRTGLNRMMGFKDEEFVCAAIAVGKEGSKPAALLKQPLMRVAPTDYCESDGIVPGWMSGTQIAQNLSAPPETDARRDVQLLRRSARRFDETSMKKGVFEHIMHMLRRTPDGMSAYAAVLRCEETEPGLYGPDGLLRTGTFAETMAALLVEQRFVVSAQIVMILTAERYDADVQMGAAAFAHTLSLDAAARGVGFSAIGAFYDKKLQTFLETQGYILYVGVFGSEKNGTCK